LRVQAFDGDPNVEACHNGREAHPTLANRAMTLITYKDLDVWKRAVELAVEADTLTDHLVTQRKFAIADQLSRAALSVPSNIAEGNGRMHTAEYVHHVSIARGSLFETESILEVAIRAKRLQESQCTAAFEQIDGISRMLTNLHKALDRRLRAGNRERGNAR
jgi:four helix bundle protein